MGKNYSLILTLVGVTLIASNVFAFGPLAYDDINCTMANQVKFDSPFEYSVFWNFHDLNGSGNLDISLPDGIELIKGELHWQGAINPDSVYQRYNILKVTKPGVYEILTTFNSTASNKPDWMKLPAKYSIFLYASKDTVLAYPLRSQMEQAIRDSLVFPGVAERRYKEQNDQQYFRARAKYNDLPYTITSDLSSMIISLSLMSDSIPKSKLPELYDSVQIAFIKMNQLLYSPPLFEHVELALSLDLLKRGTTEVVCSLPKEQLQILSKHISENMTVLYNLDEQIIKSKSPSEQAKLLSERKAFLATELKERKALLQPEPPVTH